MMFFVNTLMRSFFVMFTWYFLLEVIFCFCWYEDFLIFFLGWNTLVISQTSNLELIFVLVVGTFNLIQFWVVISCMNICIRTWMVLKTYWVELFKGCVWRKLLNIFDVFVSTLFHFHNNFQHVWWKWDPLWLCHPPHIDTHYLISAFLKWK